MVRPGMPFRYIGKSSKIRRALTPPIKDAKPQLVGTVDKPLKTGGVVCSFEVDRVGEDGEKTTKTVGLILHAHNLLPLV